MSEFEGGDWLHHDSDHDESGEKEKEEMVFNPTSVRERIDVSAYLIFKGLPLRYAFCDDMQFVLCSQEKLAILADFKNKKQPNVSRADVMAGLSKCV